MALYGYARVSTIGQDLTIQHEALRTAGCQVIRSEKKTGTKREGRTELDLLLEFLREGDTLVVTRIDRLARSMKDLQDIVHDLKGRGVALKATEAAHRYRLGCRQGVPRHAGRVSAEFETNLRRERQIEGIAIAKAKGVYKGRPRNDRSSRGQAIVPRREARACGDCATPRGGAFVGIPGCTRISANAGNHTTVSRSAGG